VMAIIAILMGLLFAVIPGVMDGSRRASASASVRTVANALKAYQNDYGNLPQVASPQGPAENRYIAVGESAAHCTEKNSGLFNVLRARPLGVNEKHVLNRRQQSYFEDHAATSSKPPRGGFADGTAFPDELEGCYIDPWGAQYCIVMDADGDGGINMSDFYTDLANPRDVVRNTPAVFSLAKDGELGGKEYRGMFQKPKSTERPDDVVSWR
jgi:type II secretory pathway pseudopilin PulG